jgi:hypothetical protein
MPSDVYHISIAFFWALIVLSLIGAVALLRDLRIGACIAFLVLVISVLAPYDKQSTTAPFVVIWWFAIPNATAGILLLVALKKPSGTASSIIAEQKN